MSEGWRKRLYYKPRIVMATNDVLESTFPAAILCVSGGQLNILRNLVQYAERRATFASEYHEHYYLTPTEEEWESLQAVVAELQGELMGCTELETLLAQIRDCVCALESPSYHGEPPAEGQEDYDDYTSVVEEDEGDPPEGFEDWDDWRTSKCKSAQKYIDDMIDIAERWTSWYTAGGVATFAILNTLLIPSAIAPPLMVVILIVEALLALGADLLGQEVENWLAEHKQGLVCAIYDAPNVSAAQTNLRDYVDQEWDCAAGPTGVYYLWGNRALSRIFDGTMKDYEDWQGNYSATYCSACAGWIQGDGWFAVPCDPPEDWYAEKAPPTGYYSKCLPRFGNIGAMWCGIIVAFTGANGYGYWKLQTVQDGSCPNQDYNAWATFAANYIMQRYCIINGTNVNEAAIASYFQAAQYENSSSIYRSTGYRDACIQLKSVTGQVKTTLQCEYLIFEGTIP